MNINKTTIQIVKYLKENNFPVNNSDKINIKDILKRNCERREK
jgi:hypothetical protein